MHSLCCWDLIPSDSEEHGEIILKIFILCIGTGSRTFMCRTFRPRKSHFTFKILQDLSTNVHNTHLNSLIHQFYFFSYCQAISEVCWFGLLCRSRQSGFYHNSQLNNTITYFNCQCRIPWRTQLLFITWSLRPVISVKLCFYGVLRQNADLENGINKSF